MLGLQCKRLIVYTGDCVNLVSCVRRVLTLADARVSRQRTSGLTSPTNPASKNAFAFNKNYNSAYPFSG